MTTSDFVAELFREFDWRWDEVLQLKNILTSERDRSARDYLRKSLVLVLYAHFEGFCVFALGHYLIAVNKAKLECGTAVAAILAGAWESVFNAMEHGDEKCRVFRKSLPNDPYLHRHWRRRHFVEELTRFSEMPVEIADDIIDTESNLKPDVLRRNLFILGLDHNFVDPLAEKIHNLLGRRNRIAHGEDRRGVPELEYNGYESAVFEISVKLIEMLEDSHRHERYRRPMHEYAL